MPSSPRADFEGQVRTFLGRVSLNPRGAYSEGETYDRLDLVESEGSGWLCLQDGTTGTKPTEGEYWMRLADNGGAATVTQAQEVLRQAKAAQEGAETARDKAEEHSAQAGQSASEASKSADAAAQAKGKSEAAQTAAEESASGAEESAQRAETSRQAIEDMTVSAYSLPAGEEASVVKTELNGAANLRFGIPRGEQGAVGPRGEQGAAGPPGEKGERGDSGVTTPASGWFTLAGDEEGNLWAYFNDSDTPPQFETDEDGNIYYITPDAA